MKKTMKMLLLAGTTASLMLSGCGAINKLDAAAESVEDAAESAAESVEDVLESVEDVLEGETEAATTAKESTSASDNSFADVKKAAEASKDNNNGAAASEGAAASSSDEISEEDAKLIALLYAGVEEENTQQLRIRQDSDDRGRLEYEVDFYDSEYNEYDFSIASSDGTVLSFDYELAKQNRNLHNSSDNKERLSEEEIKSIIASLEEDVSEDNIFVKLDNDDGQELYEGEFTADGKEYEFKLDAYDGSLVEWSMDTY